MLFRSHPCPDIGSHDIPEIFVMYQAIQAGIIGQGQGAVNGVHPFDRELHRPAAVHDAGGQVYLKDFFGGYSGGGERIELGVGEEEVEVGHGGHPLKSKISVL